MIKWRVPNAVAKKPAEGTWQISKAPCTIRKPAYSERIFSARPYEPRLNTLR